MFRRHGGARTYEVNMCEGSLMKKILAFSLPLMFSGILQLFFNAADLIVVGRFSGPTALAAVGSTGSLVNLTINLFIGLSVGASVAVANYYGAGAMRDVRETVHTAMLLSGIGGVLVGVVGVLMAETFLRMMSSPEDVIDQAALYLRIYFAGMPFLMVYNFASAVLRAVGDTKRPLYYLSIAGVLNVILNLYFVIALHMDVAGVALATILSEGVSAVLVVLCMLRSHGAINLDPRALKIHPDKLRRIARVGLPAGVQGSIFSISNVLIQSSVNGFGSIVMAGNAASANLENFVYTSMNVFYQAALAFSGQNMGAHKLDRVKRVLGVCVFWVLVLALTVGGVFYLFREPLLRIYNADPSVLEAALLRFNTIGTAYVLCGIMDVLVGELRGMGYSIVPMLVSIFGVCGVRIVWLYTVFRAQPTLTVLYLSYPVSWIITSAVHFACFLVLYKRLQKKALA